MVLAYFFWNPENSIAILKKWKISITWYGLLFSIGILLAYILGVRLGVKALSVKDKNCNQTLARSAFENFALFSIFFVLIGARLGYVFCYGFPYYMKHPEEIIKIWRGGLASHGGVLGILIWIFIFTRIYRKKVPKMSFLFVMDVVCASAGIAAFMIRVGNFINQEITGVATTLPWGVVFGNPVDAFPGVPRHPVQLYEGIGYLFLFIFLQIMSYKNLFCLGKGLISGIAFLAIFFIRFFSEFLKSHQGMVLHQDSLLTMGQILSIPFLCLGVVLVSWNLVSHRHLSK